MYLKMKLWFYFKCSLGIICASKYYGVGSIIHLPNPKAAVEVEIQQAFFCALGFTLFIDT